MTAWWPCTDSPRRPRKHRVATSILLARGCGNSKGRRLMGTEAKKRSAAELATLDNFLDEEGTREEFQAVAIKEVLAWQIEEAMKAQNLTRKGLAQRMGT